MRNRRVVRSFVVGFCTVVSAVLSSGCSGDQDEPDRIVLLARAPERGNWSPREIRVASGSAVTIVVRNVDIATHSFYLPALGIDTGPLKPGETKEVTFTPDSPGDYLFLCAVWCSDYHMYERGYLIVE